MYRIEFTPQAVKEVIKLRKYEQQTYKKLEKLLEELRKHPTTGTGKPKPLGRNRTGQWSRRITDKHRLIYDINDEKMIVVIISAYGHYNDK